MHLESFHAALAFIHGGYGTTGATFDDWRPIVHRGIKLENTLAMTNRTTYPSFKLGDFGISTKYNPDNTDCSCDTCIWQPLAVPRISTPAADVWSLGAIIHFLVLGKPLVRDIEKYKAEVIYEGERSLGITIHKTVADTGSRGHHVR